jgi:YggT family protein
VSILWQVVYDVLVAFIVIMIVRLVFDYVQMFARDWRPHGGVLVVLEICYSITDPPLRTLRGVVPALRFGRFGLDMGWITLFLAAIILSSVVGSL